MFCYRPVQTDNPLKVSVAKSESSSSLSIEKGSSGAFSTSKKPSAGVKRKSALDEIMEFEEKKKEKVNRKDHWLHENIVVKVVSKKLGDKYYKKKACVMVCYSTFVCLIRSLFFL